MNDDKVYWIWLQQVLRYANNKIRAIKIIYDTAEKFYSAGIQNWRMSGCFTPKELDGMSNYKLNNAAKILDKCSNLGYKIITIDSEQYPNRLKHLSAPPCVLYVKGEMPKVDKKICISMVGTRNATLYGSQMSFDIAFGLAKTGAIVVSGCATGIDEFSHKGAIQGGGQTIAVLGCGINYPYLLQNESLREVISQNGALISEFPPDYPSYPSNFPMRNRIISGLSLGTVVIEAGAKSGSLITASFALEQNRDVFVVPVDMNSPVSEGSTRLIRDGAKIVTCAKDILSEYRKDYFEKSDTRKPLQKQKISFERPTRNNYKPIVTKNDSLHSKPANTNRRKKANDLNPTYDRKYDTQKIKADLVANLPPDEKNVYDVLLKGKAHMDTVCEKTGIPISELLPIMTNLDIKGLVNLGFGGFYEVVDNDEKLI